MHKMLKEIKSDFEEELADIYEKQGLTSGNLETIVMLLKGIEKTETICAMRGYSKDYSSRGMIYETRTDGMSHTRGRGRNARRDSMGRYSSESSEEDVINEMREIMMDAPAGMQRKIRDLITEYEK
jgi:hypothetical protein